jgi:hypothetical protein
VVVPLKTKMIFTKHSDGSRVPGICGASLYQIHATCPDVTCSYWIREPLRPGVTSQKRNPMYRVVTICCCVPRSRAPAPPAGTREELMSFGGSIFLIAVGLVLALAVNVSVSGIDLQLVGWILALVGALGLVLSLVFYRRRRSVVVEPPPVVSDDYPPRY